MSQECTKGSQGKLVEVESMCRAGEGQKAWIVGRKTRQPMKGTHNIQIPRGGKKLGKWMKGIVKLVWHWNGAEARNGRKKQKQYKERQNKIR